MPTKREFEVRDPDILLNRIRKEFPKLEWSSFQYLDHGWDHEVIILDNMWVFRFPNSKLYLSALKREVRMFGRLADKFPRGLMPHYTYIANDKSFAGYKLLVGEELTVEKYKNLSEQDKCVVMESIADFLTRLHSIGIVEAGSYVVPEIWDHPSADELAIRLDKYLKPKLTKVEYGWAVSTLKELDKLGELKLKRALLHGDLSKNHILWDESQKAVRIIDFSDRALADPAYDFAELEDYGQEFLKEVYVKYKGHKDKDFLLRSKLYHKRVSLYLLINSCVDNKITWDEAKILFDRVHL